MKKISVASILLVAVLAVSSGPAFAQDGPTITTNPASVDSAGEHEIVVSGSGYTIPEVFVVECAGAEGDPAKVLESAPAVCDFANFVPATVDGDGNWEATVNFEVGASGLVIAAGDAEQTEVALAVVAVGSAELAVTGASSSLAIIFGVVLLAAGMLLVEGSRRFDHSG